MPLETLPQLCEKPTRNAWREAFFNYHQGRRTGKQFLFERLGPLECYFLKIPSIIFIPFFLQNNSMWVAFCLHLFFHTSVHEEKPYSIPFLLCFARLKKAKVFLSLYPKPLSTTKILLFFVYFFKFIFQFY